MGRRLLERTAGLAERLELEPVLGVTCAPSGGRRVAACSWRVRWRDAALHWCFSWDGFCPCTFATTPPRSLAFLAAGLW
eukprot:8372749-Lingulodinium_polyedra.AAC.1